MSIHGDDQPCRYEPQGEGASEISHIVVVDADAPHLSADEGDRLFNDAGEPSGLTRAGVGQPDLDEVLPEPGALAGGTDRGRVDAME